MRHPSILLILLILSLFASALPILADDPPPGYPPPATATPGSGYPAPAEPADILAVSLTKFAPDSAAAWRAVLPAILIFILILWRVLRQISRR